MNCKCGHYKYAHDYGRLGCNMSQCKCKRYKEKPSPSSSGQPHSVRHPVSDRTDSENY